MTPQRLIEPARHAGTALLRTQSDERLVDLTREGNDRAFEAIVERYNRQLVRYCGRLLPASRAEDAVQQTFLNAYAAIRDGDAELRLRPWLYRIAHNSSLNLLRQNGWNHEQVSDQIDGVETPPQAFERGEKLRSVITAVNDLPGRQRDALVLSAVEGRSYDEIASELGVTGGAVRQLLNRARNTLRAGLSALTPPGLLVRLAGTSDGAAGDRVAQVAAAGAGSSVAIAKLGAALLVAGAVVGGASQVVPSEHHRSRDRTRAHEASAAAAERRDAAGQPAAAAVLAHSRVERSRAQRARRGSEPAAEHRHHRGNAMQLADGHGGSSPSSGEDRGGASNVSEHSGGGSSTDGSGTSGGSGSDSRELSSGTSGDGGGSTSTSGTSGDGGTSSSSGDGSSGSGDSTMTTTDGSGTSGSDGGGSGDSLSTSDGGGGTSGPH